MKEGTTIVYFLQSLSKPGRFYVGITLTSRKEERLSEHNRGHTLSTRRYAPWIFIHTEEYSTKSEAAKREYYLKSLNGFQERRAICEKYKLLFSVD